MLVPRSCSSFFSHHTHLMRYISDLGRIKDAGGKSTPQILIIIGRRFLLAVQTIMIIKIILFTLSLLAFIPLSYGIIVPTNKIVMEAVAVEVNHTVDKTMPLNLKKVTPGASFGEIFQTTTPNTGLHSLALASRASDPLVTLCNAQGCTGLCGTTDMNLISEGCFSSGLLILSGIITVSGTTIPATPKIFASQGDCAGGVQLTEANTCMNFLLNGLPGFFTNVAVSTA